MKTSHPAQLTVALPAIAITFPDGTVLSSDTPDIDRELSKALGRDVRLVTESPKGASSEASWQVVEGHDSTEWTRQRTVRKEGGRGIVRWELAEAVPKVEGEDTFFDLAPIHLLTTAALRKLEALEPGTVFDYRRFRPNLLLGTTEFGFIEQEWSGKTLGFGEVSMSVMVPVPRCGMPTLQQVHEDLARDPGILRSIVRHNSLEVAALGGGRWPCLGIYVAVLDEGRLELGASIELQ